MSEAFPSKLEFELLGEGYSDDEINRLKAAFNSGGMPAFDSERSSFRNPQSDQDPSIHRTRYDPPPQPFHEAEDAPAPAPGPHTGRPGGPLVRPDQTAPAPAAGPQTGRPGGPLVRPEAVAPAPAPQRPSLIQLLGEGFTVDQANRLMMAFDQGPEHYQDMMAQFQGPPTRPSPPVTAPSPGESTEEDEIGGNNLAPPAPEVAVDPQPEPYTPNPDAPPPPGAPASAGGEFWELGVGGWKRRGEVTPDEAPTTPAAPTAPAADDFRRTRYDAADDLTPAPTTPTTPTPTPPPPGESTEEDEHRREQSGAAGTRSSDETDETGDARSY